MILICSGCGGMVGQTSNTCSCSITYLCRFVNQFHLAKTKNKPYMIWLRLWLRSLEAELRVMVGAGTCIRNLMNIVHLHGLINCTWPCQSRKKSVQLCHHNQKRQKMTLPNAGIRLSTKYKLLIVKMKKVAKNHL